MDNTNNPVEALEDIRKMMRNSSKFVSLSGLSGVLAGVVALAGAVVGHYLFDDFVNNRQLLGLTSPSLAHVELLAFGICLAVLFFSILGAFVLSGRKARKHGVRLFDHTSLKVIYSMCVPLIAGAVFCFACWYYGGIFIFLIAPIMLIFYGLGLTAADKYTIHQTRWLGLAEILLGMIALFNLGHGLLFWGVGFGIFHILYGAIMYYLVDRS